MTGFRRFLLLVQLLYSVGGVQILKGTNNYVTYYVGDTNLIITASHNGNIKPSNIPDRHNGCLVGGACVYTHSCTPRTSSCSVRTLGDSYTKYIAKRFYDKFHAVTGKYPHMIVSELKRSKLDPNREINEAAFGDPNAILAYNEFHNFISQAKTAIGGNGILFDMHGQTHPEEWIELGYLISKSKLVANNLNPSSSSIKALSNRHPNISFESFVRGQDSFGKLLNDYSYTVVPSPNNPDPTATGNYYSGGYIVKTYGSKNGGNIDAIQIEAPKNIRFNSQKRKKLGDDLGQITSSFLSSYY